MMHGYGCVLGRLPVDRPPGEGAPLQVVAELPDAFGINLWVLVQPEQRRTPRVRVVADAILSTLSTALKGVAAGSVDKGSRRRS